MPKFGSGRPSRLFTIKDGITQGLLGDFIDCRQRAEYRCQGWRTIGISRAMEFGSLFHALLEAWYTNWGLTPISVLRQVEPIWRKRARLLGDEAQAVEKDLAVAGALFQRYCTFWLKQDTKKKWLELEGVFDQPWNGYRLRGRCDGLYERGGVWLFETKTKSTLVEDNIAKALAFDWQSLYYILAKEAQTGKKIAGVCYNVIRTPSLKLGQDERLPDYCKRLGEDVDKRPDWYFMRYECAYTRKGVEWAAVELRNKLAEFDTWAHGQSQTYCNQASCCSRWQCSFLPACATGSMVGFERMRKWRYHELEEGGK
jgi:hypothetical protein